MNYKQMYSILFLLFLESEWKVHLKFPKRKLHVTQYFNPLLKTTYIYNPFSILYFASVMQVLFRDILSQLFHRFRGACQRHSWVVSIRRIH